MSTDAIASQLIALSRRVGKGPADDEALLGTALLLVRDLVPGARWASVTYLEAEPRTLGASHAPAAELDAVQYRTGAGPCLEALETGSVVISEFAAETRWPAFTRAALADTSARGALSYPLDLVGHAATTLNLYTDASRSFDGTALHEAALAAAGLALTLTAMRRSTARDGRKPSGVVPPPPPPR